MKINFINPFSKAARTYVLCQTNGLGHCVQTIGIFDIPSHEDKTHNSFSKGEFFCFFIKLILAVWRGSEYFRNISDFFLNQIDSSRLAIILIFQKHFWSIQEISKHYFLIKLILAGLRNFWNISEISEIFVLWCRNSSIGKIHFEGFCHSR